MSTPTQTQTEPRARRLSGTVVKSAMQDTATVLVSRFVKHPKYRKYMKREQKYLVHDSGNSAVVGQKVTIESCRPISKRKTFKLVSIETNDTRTVAQQDITDEVADELVDAPAAE